ncbi:hypothetical protein K457DRAFT_13642 [Linnemannia elongata AG-77]|uniref:Uncharacterized protein n=1 Tax=Linnemannia elongata AG-77 TaxID=1314771 RepID=A0A197KFB8_9FUNG|nr:hypothetical protein K457DRAFT_13642 [Linnemannia elongata AG-77]
MMIKLLRCALVIIPTLLSAAGSVWNTLPKVAQGDAEQLINDNIGVNTPATVAAGYALMLFRSAALARKTSVDPISRDSLARSAMISPNAEVLRRHNVISLLFCSTYCRHLSSEDTSPQSPSASAQDHKVTPFEQSFIAADF